MGKLADLFVNIGAKTDDFSKGINNVQKETSQLSANIGKFGAMVAGAFAVDRLISFGAEISKLAQASEGVEIAFKRIGGDEIMGGLRKATKGTVSDLELMKAAVQASNFKIPLEQLGSLLAFAHQRAKDTGQSVDYLVQSIILGIGRKSPLILDNLGISAVSLKEKLGGVAGEAATVGDVAKAVGAIATEEMAKIGESVDTNSDKFAQQQAVIENWKVSLGKGLNEILGVFTSIVSKLDDMISRMATIIASKNISGWQKFLAMLDSRKFEEVSDGLNKMQKTAEINADAWISKLKDQLKTYQGDSEKAMQYLKDLRMKLVEQMGEFEGKDIAKMPKEYQIAFSEIQIEYNKINQLINSPIGIDEMLFPDGADKVVEDVKKVKNELDEFFKGINDQADKNTSITDFERYSPDSLPAKLTGKGANVKQSLGEKVVYNKDAKTYDVMGVVNATSGADQLEEFANRGMSAAKDIQSVSESISESMINMSDAIGTFIEEFAAGIGELIAGTASWNDFGSLILKSVANFMTSLGRQLIALGVAAIAAKFLATNPYTAIAAGAMLVALGTAASAAISSNPMSGSLTSTSRSSYSNVGSQSNTLEIVGVTRGEDIYWSQKRTADRLSNTSTRSR